MVILFITAGVVISGALFGLLAQLVNTVINELLQLDLDFNPVNYSLILGSFMVLTGKIPLLLFPVFFLAFLSGAKVTRLYIL